MMAKTIAICNQKGGVGKSTTAVNVGSYLALLGKQVLLVDLDPQGNATISCGVSRGRVTKTLHEALIDGLSLTEALISSPIERLDVVPSSFDLADLELKLAQGPERETVIRKLCEPLQSRYDAILFDCPPSLGVLTVNALVASDCVLIPVQCEYLALEGLNALLRAIDQIKQQFNPHLKLGGIVLTMADFRANLTREVSEEVKRFFKDLVFETTIPRNVRLAESPSFGRPVCVYDPTSSGALAYQMLAREVALKIGLMEEKDTVTSKGDA